MITNDLLEFPFTTNEDSVSYEEIKPVDLCWSPSEEVGEGPGRENDVPRLPSLHLLLSSPAIPTIPHSPMNTALGREKT